jgi:hypothetical protein
MQHLRNRQRVDRWGRREHGGYGRPDSDVGLAIAVDAAGAAYVTGNTESAEFTAGCMAPSTVLDSTLAGTFDAFVAKISHIGVPATLTLTPAAAKSPVNTQHCVTATVEDASGNPTPAITVRFSVTGSVTTSGPATTDTNGQPTFCYAGPLFPSTDTITAYADPNTNTTQHADEPRDGATKTWVLPPTTADCKVTGEGQLTANHGDKATFGGNADSQGPKGHQAYTDHGPATPRTVTSVNVRAVVCSSDHTHASIHGDATVNGHRLPLDAIPDAPRRCHDRVPGR